MKSDETIKRLSKNPYYALSEEEKQRLDTMRSAPKASSKTIDENKKKVSTALGNATVKEIGKLEKHSSDPVVE